MAKRIFDIVFSIFALALFLPLMALGALGIALSSPGPIIYRASRVGKNGALFTMYKLRTMHVDHGNVKSAITANSDSRVFPLGRFLRYSKIDEMPQFANILLGDMSIVGPRPEDPEFVNEHYSEKHKETLKARPGLTSPGSLYYYTHLHKRIGHDNPEKDYIEKVLSEKLAVDMAYLENQSFYKDLKVILKTLLTIAQIVAGKKDFKEPKMPV